MSLFRTLLTRVQRAMSARPPPLSEKELRALTHDQLLAYTLQHVQIPSSTPGKRPVPEADPDSSANQPRSHQPAKKKKRHKVFDMTRYGQRMVALRLVYTGWRFHGFAAQTTSENTVEHHLFAALLRTRLIESRETCCYSRSGRTDVGVSALGQVVGLRLRSSVVPPSSSRTELDYVKVINGNLPEGIRVLAWVPVSDGTTMWPKTYPGDPEPVRRHWRSFEEGKKVADPDIVRRPGEPFSARFDAIYRSYKYFFLRGGQNIDAMRTAAKHFEGTHDFRNFCRIDENVTNFQRHMYDVDIRIASVQTNRSGASNDSESDEHTMYYIFVRGQAFLWHQVRCMAAVLFDVGMGREHPSLIKRMLDDANKGVGRFSSGKPHYRMASPIPLLLFECAYPDSVVAFPQAFDRGKECAEEDENGDDVVRKSAFEKADAVLAQLFAETAAQASILEAMLLENDMTAASPNNEDVADASGGDRRKWFKAFREPRNFLLDLNRGKHIPYEVRPCDDSVETKQERAAEKKKVKEMCM